jgi:hypothetical protein
MLAFVAVAVLSLAFATSALGESATEDAYGGTAGVQQFDEGEGNSGGGNSGTEATTETVEPSSTESSSSGSLPFTGLDVGLIALAGVALVGTGLLVRRATRSDTHA